MLKKYYHYLILVLLSMFLLPTLSFATSHKYYVGGTVFSALDNTTSELSGYITINDATVGNDYIESIINSNGNYFALSYDIIDSNIRFESGEVFSEGSGNINLEYALKSDAYWSNNNTWNSGFIEDSMTENDVVFYDNDDVLGITEFDVLPNKMHLRNGLVFGDGIFTHFPINLMLTQEIIPVPEPGSALLLCFSLVFLFYAKRK